MASASVSVDKQVVSSISRGILVLCAVAPTDTQKEVEAMATKVLKMKMWPDEGGANVGVPLLLGPMHILKTYPVEEECHGYRG